MRSRVFSDKVLSSHEETLAIEHVLRMGIGIQDFFETDQASLSGTYIYTIQHNVISIKISLYSSSTLSVPHSLLFLLQYYLFRLIITVL